MYNVGIDTLHVYTWLYTVSMNASESPI